MKKKEIIEIIITCVAAIILVLLIFSNMKKRKAAVSLISGPVSSSGVSLSQKGGGEDLFMRLDRETKDLEIKRDLFFIEVKTLPEGPSLNGIAWDDLHPTAIVNNKIVEIGSKVENYTVVDIKKDRVILDDGQTQLELKLGL